MRYGLATTLLLSALLVPTGCRPTSDPGGQQRPPEDSASGSESSPVAAASFYLAAAYCDVMGHDRPPMVLAEPGMCPGHFDLRPSQVRQLHSCRMLLRFDFQQSIDARLGEDRDQGLRIVGATVPGGMCEPESYESVCRQLAQALAEDQRVSAEEAEGRLATVGERMDALDRWAADEIEAASLRGAPVLSSGHQAAFCRHLGLAVAAEFSAADTASTGQIDRAVRAGEAAKVRLVVANLPEGRQLADALADRLGAKVVVFGNFPDDHTPRAFDELVRRNVTALVQASKP